MELNLVTNRYINATAQIPVDTSIEDAIIQDAVVEDFDLPESDISKDQFSRRIQYGLNQMKKFIFLLFCFVLLNTIEVFAQTKKVGLSSCDIRYIEGRYYKQINLESTETSYFLTLQFRNSMYFDIIDLKVTLLTKQEDLDEFIKDLKTAIPEMGTKTNLKWERKLYAITLNDNSSNLYLHDRDQIGYTTINKKGVEKLITWLETIQIGKG